MLRFFKAKLRNPVNKARLFYKKCRRAHLAHQYLKGDGIEIGALHNPLWLPKAAKVKYVDRLSVADLRQHYPELSPFRVVDPDIIDDGEKLLTIPAHSLDFIIANHFIEHCQDPIGTLKVFLSKLQPGGVIYMAVPDKRYTFDVSRPITSFEHLLKDHQDGPEWSYESHFDEVAKSMIAGSGGSSEELENIKSSLLSQKYSIHYHVWDKEAFRDFLIKLDSEFGLSVSILREMPIFEEVVFVIRGKCE